MNSKVEDLNEKDEQKYICNYLKSHPNFAKQWFLENMRSELIDKKDNISGSTLVIQNDSSCNKCSKNYCNDIHSYDAKLRQTNDEEFLTASYAEMARGGRNSITSDLFHEIVECGRKKNNITNSPGMALPPKLFFRQHKD